MRRFVDRSLAGTLVTGETIMLPESVAHHLKTVLRMQLDDPVELSDGDGIVAQAKIISLTPVEVLVESNERVERSSNLAMFVAVLKKDRWSWLLEKLGELGVSEIYPVITERTVVEPKNIETKKERWTKIVENAARQSGQYHLPVIHDPIDFDHGLTLPYTHLFGAFDTESDVKPRRDSALWIGPEGGFTEREIEQLSMVATAFTFSNHVLRAETAAVVGAGILLSSA